MNESEPRRSADPDPDAKAPGPGGRPPFRWTERRAARVVTIVLSAAVVVADAVLFVVFLRQSATFPDEAKRWVPAIGFGIIAIFVYAAGRLVRQIGLFVRDE